MHSLDQVYTLQWWRCASPTSAQTPTEPQVLSMSNKGIETDRIADTTEDQGYEWLVLMASQLAKCHSDTDSIYWQW